MHGLAIPARGCVSVGVSAAWCGPPSGCASAPSSEQKNPAVLQIPKDRTLRASETPRDVELLARASGKTLVGHAIGALPGNPCLRSVDLKSS